MIFSWWTLSWLWWHQINWACAWFLYFISLKFLIISAFSQKFVFTSLSIQIMLTYMWFDNLNLMWLELWIINCLSFEFCLLSIIIIRWFFWYSRSFQWLRTKFSIICRCSSKFCLISWILNSSTRLWSLNSYFIWLIVLLVLSLIIEGFIIFR